MLTGPFVLHRAERPQKLVVILHGYGADGANLIDIAHQWAPQFPAVDFLAPNAPDICEINPMGYQWFGLRDFSPFNIRQGLDRIRPVITTYLQNELQARALGPEDLVVMGFSQGAMIALDVAFSIPGLSGILAYSGAFYPAIAAQPPQPSPQILLVHGMVDMVVPFAALAEADRQLRLFGIIPQAHPIPHLGHGIDSHCVQLGTQFLDTLFTKSQPIQPTA